MAFFALPAIPAIVEGILWLGGGAAVAGAAHQALPGKEQREQSIANVFGGSSSPPNEAMMMQGAKDGAGADAVATSGTDATNCLGECGTEEEKRKRQENEANQTHDNIEDLEGQSFDDVEAMLDRKLRDNGWQKDLLDRGDGWRYTSPNGNRQIRINRGYPTSNRYGQSNSIHRGPYIARPSTKTRIPLR